MITPCTDGERVYVAFSSGVLAAVDFQGTLLWHKTYVDLRGREQRKQPIRSEEFGTLSTSPVLYKDMVIMVCDPGHGAPDYPLKGTIQYDFIKKTPAFINAFDCKTGDLRYWEDRPNDAGNCSTPILVTWKDKTVLMHKNSRGILGFDPANGKVIWTANIHSYPTTSLVYSDGLLFMNTATIGRPAENIAFSVDAESTGNISQNVAWRFPSGPGGGYSSPVIMDGVMYKYLAAGGGNVGKGSTKTSPFIGKLYCLDIKTGKQLHVLDMPWFSSWSSPVGSADGYLYFASGTKSYVVKTGPTPEIVAINNLGDYNPAPSPAIVDGKLIIRGSSKLWCIGKP
jgi:outer membrane protein assembly factor BamB